MTENGKTFEKYLELYKDSNVKLDSLTKKEGSNMHVLERFGSSYSRSPESGGNTIKRVTVNGRLCYIEKCEWWSDGVNNMASDTGYTIRSDGKISIISGGNFREKRSSIVSPEEIEDKEIKIVLEGEDMNSVKFIDEWLVEQDGTTKSTHRLKFNNYQATKNEDGIIIEEITGRSAFKKIAEIKKQGSELPEEIVRCLAESADKLKNDEIITDFCKTIGKYNGNVAVTIAANLNCWSNDFFKNKDGIRKGCSILSSDEVVNNLNKQRNGVATSIANNFSEIVFCLGNENEILEINRIIGNHDDEFAKDLSNTLAHVAHKNKNGKEVVEVANLINKMHEKDTITAKMACKGAPIIFDTFYDKSKDVFRYLEKRNDRNSIFLIENIFNRRDVAKAIKNIKTSDLGNKRTKKLIKLASYLDLHYELELKPPESEDLQTAFSNAEQSIKNYMEGVGVKDIQKGIEFLPWVKTKDPTALKVLGGEKIEKNGIARTYALKNGSSIDLKEIRAEIQSYANMVGVNISVKDGNLSDLKNYARKIMSEVSKKKDIGANVLNEVKPNLSRILNIIDKGSENLELYINPSDLESQMKALQNVSSCLSPGGCNFKYTKQYLENPNTFWAVIKDKEKVVGRFTMFTGDYKGKEERPAKIARASRVYSIVPVNEKSVDEALKEYAKEMRLEFIKSGTMHIEGLREVYDDFVRGNNGNVILGR